MNRAASILLIALAAACRTPRTDGSGALVSAGGRTEVIERVIREVEPMIIDALGTSWPWKYRVGIDPDWTRFAAYTRTFDRRVGLGPKALEDFRALQSTLAHEIVHVHMTGEWRELPPVLQEGIADWIAAVVTGNAAAEWEGDVPTPELARRVMTMRYDEYKELSREDRHPIDSAATYLASRIVRFGAIPTQRWAVLRVVQPGSGVCSDVSEE